MGHSSMRATLINHTADERAREVVDRRGQVAERDQGIPCGMGLLACGAGDGNRTRMASLAVRRRHGWRGRPDGEAVPLSARA